MWELISKTRDILDPREKRRGALVIGLFFLAGFAESARVASIVPLVAVIADPGVIETNSYLAAVYQWLDLQSTRAFLFVLGAGALAVTLGSLMLSFVASWATLRFVAMSNYRLSRDLLRLYINHPYEWFLRRHSADLGHLVLSEVNMVTKGILTSFMLLITGSVTAAFLVVLLVIADPVLAVFISVQLGVGFAVIYGLSRQYLRRIGEERHEANRQCFRSIGEIFGAIKDVKLLGLEKTFIGRFDGLSKRLVSLKAASEAIGQLPQYGLQALAFVIMLMIVWYQLAIDNNVSQALPVIALYALAGTRLMPALQQIYQATSKLRFTKPSLDALHRDLCEQQAPRLPTHAGPSIKPMGLRKEIELKNLGYRYPSSLKPILRGVSLKIETGMVVGFVGRTGAGKTTLVDVISGLLEPDAGELRVDGARITKDNSQAWQKSLGYVPQQIFLCDDTVAANIAFGLEPGDIDLAAVERAARITNLHHFVTTELAQGYDTEIGERGIRLSGGQRQRVGIARALYHDPDVLIMDEGTSALDNITERAVMDAVNNLGRAKTVILIAHRLTTVRTCDRIFLFDEGRLVADGTYDELVSASPSFRDMVASVA